MGDSEDKPIGKTLLEAVTGSSRRKSDGPVAFLRTLTIVGACLAAAWQLLRTQQENYHELVKTIMVQNEAQLSQILSGIRELKDANQQLAETIRTAMYVEKGADPPKKMAEKKEQGHR